MNKHTSSIMLHILVVTFAFLAVDVRGYDYPAPSVPLSSPNNQVGNQNVPLNVLNNYNIGNLNMPLNLPNYQVNNLNNEYNQYSDTSGNHLEEKTLSYSLSYKDYNYLKQYKSGQNQHQNSQYNPGPVSNHQGYSYNEAHNSNAGQVSPLPWASQTVLSQNTANNLNSAFAPVVRSRPVEPLISKHVYFHVPPPDIEEPPVQIRTPPSKKTYNIIFIKVPSQSHTHASRLQALLQRRPITSVENKTLIYVLVKKPEPHPVSTVLPMKSEHEVFFVKYKGNLNNAVTQINDQLAQTLPVENTSTLRPGLVNGHW